MDFELTITNLDDNSNEAEMTYRFEQLGELLTFLGANIGQWNNFKADNDLDIKIRKVPSDTPTLGVQASEDIKAEEIFGRP